MTWTTLSFPYASLLTSTKMTQLYDNITAQANGDTGAPKQQTNGIADDAVTAAKIKGPAAGTSYVTGSSCSSSSTTSITALKIKEIIVPFAGSIGCTFSLKGLSSSTPVYARVYKNGTAAGTLRSVSSTSYSDFSESSITVAAGDLLQIYAYITPVSGNTAVVRNFILTSSVLPPNCCETLVL